MAGQQCAVLLPAVLLDSSPRFSRFRPLSKLVAQSSAAWERQKRLLAEEAEAEPQAHRRSRVSFLEKPNAVPAEYFSEDVRPCPPPCALLPARSRSLSLSLSISPNLASCAYSAHCSRLSAQGFHPNDVGYEAWGGYIAQHLLQRCLAPSPQSDREQTAGVARA